MNRLLSAFALLVAAVTLYSCAGAKHWTYDNPATWQEDGYRDCGLTHQSPIAINSSTMATDATLPIVSPQFTPFAIKVIDNGHTIQFNASGSNTLLYGDGVYSLQQFHFHHHSEHVVDGKTADLEMHLVYADASGRMLVIGVLFDSHVGGDNPFIERLWSLFPTAKNIEETKPGLINPNDLLPADKSYYTYSGSLTAPPCSQGVTWIVLKRWMPMSDAQVARFASIYPNNARPAQETNDRIVRQTQ